MSIGAVRLADHSNPISGAISSCVSVNRASILQHTLRLLMVKFLQLNAVLSAVAILEYLYEYQRIFSFSVLTQRLHICSIIPVESTDVQSTPGDSTQYSSVLLEIPVIGEVFTLAV